MNFPLFLDQVHKLAYMIGSFGKVKLVKNKKDSKYACVKIMKKNEIIQAKQADHIIN